MTVTLNAPKFHVGQAVEHVAIRRGYGAPERATPHVVTKVSRVWGHARPAHLPEDYDGSLTIKFNLATGLVHAGGYSPNSRVVTPEILADETAREEALAAIKDRFGLTPTLGGGATRLIPTALLQKLAATDL